MEIYDYFNSPDVAGHCKSLGHTLNSIEAAVMVSECNFKSLAEKHATYKAIIAEYPDMELPAGGNHAHFGSFHKVLASVIVYEERELELFFACEPGCVYQAWIHSRDGLRVDTQELELYTNYENSLAEALEHCKNWEESRKEYHHLDCEPIMDITIRKRYPDNKNYISAKLSHQGIFLEITHSEILDSGKIDEAWLLQSIYIDIPVPFKRGDLVELDDGGYMGEIFVLQNICRDNTEENADRLYRADLMDMTAGVHYIMDGEVQCDVIHFYPNLRYCRRELKGEARILKYISYHIQDKLCLCGLLKMQKYLMLKEKIDQLADNYDLRYQLAELNESLPEYGRGGGNP